MPELANNNTNSQRRLDMHNYLHWPLSVMTHTSSCSIDLVFILCFLKTNQVILAVSWKSYSFWPQFKAFLLYDVGILFKCQTLYLFWLLHMV